MEDQRATSGYHFDADAYLDSVAQLLPEIDAQTAKRPGAPTTHPAFDQVVRLVWRLRQQDGCAWDLEQTHQSLEPYVLEEAAEVAEVLRQEPLDAQHLKEELGDLLEQVLLHATLAEEEGLFTIDDVCCDLTAKLIGRHPHVFGPVEARSTNDVDGLWKQVKAAEKKRRA